MGCLYFVWVLIIPILRYTSWDIYRNYSQQYLVENICRGRQGLSSTGRGHAAIHCHGYHSGCDETHRTNRGLGVACQHPGDGERGREG